MNQNSPKNNRFLPIIIAACIVAGIMKINVDAVVSGIIPAV